MQTSINKNPQRDRNGIVTNPKNSINFVVQETPVTQGAMLSGRIFQYKRL